MYSHFQQIAVSNYWVDFKQFFSGIKFRVRLILKYFAGRNLTELLIFKYIQNY